ncbi:MAG: hypothetical protein DSY85_14585 [Marinomonas sp.]|nr:MAG: hypothetical protein DSY85_14585 [Marinomonas sp.]
MTNTLSQQIQEHFSALSKSERALANFLLTNPDCLMVESAASLASKVGVSAMTVSRFIRKIGFIDHSEAKNSVKKEVFGTVLPDAGGFEQRYELYGHSDESDKWSSENLELEIAAIRQVHELRRSAHWQRCVELLASADAVYLASYQVIRHIAIGFSAQLECVRPRVCYLDGLDGTYGQLFTDPAAHKTIVVIDTYPYTIQAEKLAVQAVEAGLDLVVICDEFCHWAREISDNVLSVTTNTGMVFRSKAAMSILTNLLTNDIISSLGDSSAKHMEIVTKAEDRFGQTTKETTIKKSQNTQPLSFE